MADIFISYSRKDSERAEMLAEMLTSAGLSCWLDQHGIEIATSWSGEIVDAIDECKAMIVMLSQSSNESKNVAKEVALASERNKKILPLDLEPISLSRDLAYHLAGVQRAPMSNIDAIIRALGKLGLEATGTPQGPKMKEGMESGHSRKYAAPKPVENLKKSLMILPFEDLSPTGDNQWFGDGLMSELISALSNIDKLRLIDQKTSLGYKGSNVGLAQIAHELNVRYFLEGSVRKFGDQIKVTTQLLDADEGEHLWSDSHRGEFKDIFEIQEAIAIKVVAALKLKLSAEEATKVVEQKTENSEAYELMLRANDLHYTDAPNQLKAKAMLERAIELDPKFVNAYTMLAGLIANLGSKVPNYRQEQERLIMKALTIDPLYPGVYAGLANLHIQKKEYRAALDMAKKMLEIAPQRASANSWMGYCYIYLQDWKHAAEYYERALELEPTESHYVNHLAGIYLNAGDHEMLRRRASEWLPLIEHHLSQFSNDPDSLIMRLILLIETCPESVWREAYEDISEHHSLEPDARFSLAAGLSHYSHDSAEYEFKRAIAEGARLDKDILSDQYFAPAFTETQFYKDMLAEF